ncbi:MAG: hypothetical protein ACJ8AT_05435, partial [Hyalangium sp.]|uniref:hypothetical protein n=1 Tax=Hyalangium sp. TaxID=2028555 RepID=UPI003899A573
DPTLNRLVKESFQYVYEDPNHLPNGAESQKWLKVAQDLAAGGMSATDIKFELRRQIRLGKDGLDNTSDPTLNRLVKESFQYVYEDPNHLPNGAESQKWLKVAQDLAANGSSATDIKFELRRQIRLGKDGLDNTSDPTLNRLVEESFRYVLENQYRPTSNREKAEWLKLAQQLRDQGSSATEIQFELRRQIRTSLANR